MSLSAESPSPRLVAVALIEDDRAEAPLFLVARRRPEAHLGGAWELPGGRIEALEAPEEALSRELGEELGLRVAPGAFSALTFSFYRYPQRTVLLLFFHLRWHRQTMGSPRALDATELRWLDTESILALPMPPANDPLKALLSRGLPAPLS